MWQLTCACIGFIIDKSQQNEFSGWNENRFGDRKISVILIINTEISPQYDNLSIHRLASIQLNNG